MESLHSLNPFAVMAATVAMLITAWLLISPFLFGRAWIRLSGIRPGDIRPEHARASALIRCVTSFIAAILLGVLTNYAAYDACTVLYSIVFIWIFIMLQQFNGFFWRREPFALFLLVTLRSLLALLAGGLVFIFWR